jgi:hypothetical protein
MSAELVVPVLRICADCGGEVEPGVEPIGLFRPVPDAPAGKSQRAGGRRWREYDLCRRCRAEALRQRAARGGTVMEAGRKRCLSTRERVPPKKGGRPRLLSDDELRAAHRLYKHRGLSIPDLARALAEQRTHGSFGGYSYALFAGWRRLGLQTRERGKAVALARFGTDGTKSKPRKLRCEARVKRGPRKGQRCRCYAMRGSRFCTDHGGRDGRIHAT